MKKITSTSVEVHEPFMVRTNGKDRRPRIINKNYATFVHGIKRP